MKQIIGLALVLALPSAEAMAAASAAMLHSNGGVSVNGSAVLKTSTVFSGDRIETAPHSAVSMSMRGSSLLVNENSRLIFTGKDVSFTCGGAVLSTTQALSARFGRVAVTPTANAAKYELLQHGATLKIAALDGNLYVFDGAKTSSLAPGESVNIAYNGCPSSDDNDNSNPRSEPRKAGAALHDDSTGAVVAGTSVVIAVGIAALVSVSQKSISPTGP